MGFTMANESEVFFLSFEKRKGKKNNIVNSSRSLSSTNFNHGYATIGICAIGLSRRSDIHFTIFAEYLLSRFATL